MAEVEVMARVERRRNWSDDERVALLAELDLPGSTVPDRGPASWLGFCADCIQADTYRISPIRATRWYGKLQNAPYGGRHAPVDELPANALG